MIDLPTARSDYTEDNGRTESRSDIAVQRPRYDQSDESRSMGKHHLFPRAYF